MHRSKRTTALMLLLALCACAAPSVQGLQKRAPVLVIDSARDVTRIMTCVSAAWLKLGQTPKSVPRENGAMLVLGDIVPFLVLDATSIPTGTHVVLNQFKTMWSASDRHRVEEVRACL